MVSRVPSIVRACRKSTIRSRQPHSGRGSTMHGSGRRDTGKPRWPPRGSGSRSEDGGIGRTHGGEGASGAMRPRGREPASVIPRRFPDREARSQAVERPRPGPKRGTFSREMIRPEKDHPLGCTDHAQQRVLVHVIPGFVLDLVPHLPKGIHLVQRAPQLRIAHQASRDVKGHVMVALPASRAVAGGARRPGRRAARRRRRAGGDSPGSWSWPRQRGQRAPSSRNRAPPRHPRRAPPVVGLQMIPDRCVHVASMRWEKVFGSDEPGLGLTEDAAQKPAPSLHLSG